MSTAAAAAAATTADLEPTVETLSSELNSFRQVATDHFKKLSDLTKRIVKVRRASAEKKPRGRKKRAEGEPRRPKTSYMFYAASRRDALTKEGKKVTEIAKICGEEWRKLDAKGKAPFEAQNAEDKKRYNAEMETFKASAEEA